MPADFHSVEDDALKTSGLHDCDLYGARAKLNVQVLCDSGYEYVRNFDNCRVTLMVNGRQTVLIIEHGDADA